jgi:hypothetical protein
LVWKWWDGWSLWWAEEGGEGVLLGVLLEDSDVGIPGGLGGVVGAEGGGVLEGECSTRGVDGLGDLGWEVSHLSQIELGAVVCSVVLRGAESGGVGGANIAGDWDVGDVTVELGHDGCELKTDSSGVLDRGLTGGHPVGGHVGGSIHRPLTLTVPGSEGGELDGWHREEWEHTGLGEAFISLQISSTGSCGCFIETLTT